MKKESFVDAIKAIENQMKKDAEVAGHLSKAFPNAFEANLLPVNSMLYDTIISLLEESVDDVEGFVEWFVYDNDFGRAGLGVWDKDNNPIPIKSIEDLWNLFH